MYSFIVHRIFGVAHRLNLVIERAPDEPRTTFVFVHGIGSSHKMWRKTQQDLRRQTNFNDVDFVSIDLLGFGESPRPDWAVYDTTIQAKSLHRTLKRQIGGKRVVLVGHSLGALVAVEYAKLHPEAIDQLVLCSPPFYRQSTGRLPTPDVVLQRAYEEFARRPEQSAQILLKMQKYSLVNEGYSIDKTNAPIFINTLESSIMNQTAYDDALEMHIPTTILSGVLDPVVVDANIATLARQNKNVKRKRIALAAHEISPIYRKELVKTLSDVIA